MSIADTIKKAMIAGTLAVASYFSPVAHAQDSWSDDYRPRQEQSTKKPLGAFQFFKPDAAFPGKHQYGQLQGTFASGDYSGFGLDAQGRVDTGKDYRLSGNAAFDRVDPHPADLPFRVERRLPDVGDNTQSFDSSLNHTRIALSLDSDLVYVFGTWSGFEKEINSREDAVLNPDPDSYTTKETINESKLDSRGFALGGDYSFSNGLNTQIGLFSHKHDDALFTKEHDLAVDTTTDPDTILGETTNETRSNTKLSRKGVLLGAAYPFEDKDATLGGYFIVSKQDAEFDGDDENDTIFRFLARGTYKGATLELGFNSKNREDDGQFLASADYVIPFSERAGLAAMAGLDDDGEVQAGLWIVAGDKPQEFQRFMHTVRDRAASPFEDDIHKYTYLEDLLAGEIRRGTTFFLGAHVYKAFEPRISESGTVSEEELVRVRPTIGFQAGRVIANIFGDVGSDHNTAGARLYVQVSDNVTIVAGADSTQADDKISQFDDKISVLLGINAKFGK